MRRDHRDRKIAALEKKNKTLALTIAKLTERLHVLTAKNLRINPDNDARQAVAEFREEVCKLVMIYMVEDLPIHPVIRDHLSREMLGMLDYEAATVELRTLRLTMQEVADAQFVSSYSIDLTSTAIRALLTGAHLEGVDLNGLEDVIRVAYSDAVNEAIANHLKPYLDNLNEQNQRVLESIEQFHPS